MKGGSSRGHLLLWEPGHEEFKDAFSNNLIKKESCLLNGKYVHGLYKGPLWKHKVCPTFSNPLWERKKLSENIA